MENYHKLPEILPHVEPPAKFLFWSEEAGDSGAITPKAGPSTSAFTAIRHSNT